MEVPETRQLRWEREALLQSKFASGDDVFTLRHQIAQVKQELLDVTSIAENAPTDIEKKEADTRMNQLSEELYQLNERDAEFKYAMAKDLMEQFEVDGDVEGMEKYRVQMEEARLCIPQLNMHGLWVGK